MAGADQERPAGHFIRRENTPTYALSSSLTGRGALHNSGKDV